MTDDAVAASDILNTFGSYAKESRLQTDRGQDYTNQASHEGRNIQKTQYKAVRKLSILEQLKPIGL